LGLGTNCQAIKAVSGVSEMILLLLHIIISSIIPPFYSFSMVESICKKKLSKNPHDHHVLWFLANYYVWYEKYVEAQPILESLLKLERDLKDPKLLLARIYYHLEQHDKVKEILSGPGILSDKDKENYYLGDSLISIGEHSSGIEYLKRYSMNYSNNYVVFVKLGYAYYKEGLYMDALQSYRKAAVLNPNNKEIQDSVVLCLRELNRRNS